jgi:hypothetical protein
MADDTNKPQSWWPGFLRSSKSSEAGIPPDERTSLLSPTHDEGDFAGETYELEESTASTLQLVSQEFWVLLKGSLPVILAYALQNSLQTVSVLIVGRLSPEALATAAFSYMFAMATGWLIALGGTTAIDTLASASFTGSKNRHDLGIILQRSFIVLLLFYIPVAVLWFCSEPLFRALGQEEYIAHDSARFLSVLAPGGIGYIFFEALKKYLQAQGIHGSKIVEAPLTDPCRNHETRNLRPPYYVPFERWVELSLRIHIQDGVAWGTACNWHSILGFISAASCVCTVCEWLGLLGWLGSQVSTKHADVRTLGFPWSHSCWHRVVGFRSSQANSGQYR